MAVKPYWWCPQCSTSHDAAVSKCMSCGRIGIDKRSARVASIAAPSVERNDVVMADALAYGITRRPGDIGGPNAWTEEVAVRTERLDMPDREAPTPGVTMQRVPGTNRRVPLEPEQDPIPAIIPVKDWPPRSNPLGGMIREWGPGIAATTPPTPPQRRRLQTTCWAPYDVWDSLEDA